MVGEIQRASESTSIRAVFHPAAESTRRRPVARHCVFVSAECALVDACLPVVPDRLLDAKMVRLRDQAGTTMNLVPIAMTALPYQHSDGEPMTSRRL